MMPSDCCVLLFGGYKYENQGGCEFLLIHGAKTPEVDFDLHHIQLGLYDTKSHAILS